MEEVGELWVLRRKFYHGTIRNNLRLHIYTGTQGIPIHTGGHTSAARSFTISNMCQVTMLENP